MNGSGCKSCPVNPCHTLHYRGSYCAEQRAKHGLGDPMTNADRIRAMTDEKLSKWIAKFTLACVQESTNEEVTLEDGFEPMLAEWLKHPAEVEDGN